MPVFRCRVADEAGRIEEILQEAMSEDPLLRELSSRFPYVLSVEQVDRGKENRPGKRYSRKVVSELTDLLSLMLGSGLSLKDSLEVAETVAARGPAGDLISLLLEKLRKGSTYAAALEGAGGSFPPVYHGMVRIGERIGSLDQVFIRLSGYLSDEKKLREKFGGALLYPAVVLCVAIFSAVLIVTVLFPRMKDVFSQVGPGMSARIESLMGSLTVAFIVLGGILCLLVVLLILAVRARRKGAAMAYRIDSFLLRLPVVSTFLMQRELLSFAFAMETLTAAGVSVEEALTEGAGAVGNRALKKDITDIKEKVMKGEHLSAAFARSRIFPSRISRWIGIGERVGHVEKVFAQLRTYYQQEVDKWISRLMTLIEPTFIVILGILIILFVVVFIIPVFSLYGNIM